MDETGSVSFFGISKEGELGYDQNLPGDGGQVQVGLAFRILEDPEFVDLGPEPGAAFLIIFCSDPQQNQVALADG